MSSSTPRSRYIPVAVKRAVDARDRGICQECMFPAHKPHYDHIIPFSHLGEPTVENIRVLCERCNTRKGSKQNWTHKTPRTKTLASRARWLRSKGWPKGKKIPSRKFPKHH